jgi:hypothetical protein
MNPMNEFGRSIVTVGQDLKWNLLCAKYIFFPVLFDSMIV